MNSTPIPLSAAEVLDREYLLVRAKLLEIAASLDRMDRAGGSVSSDRRMQLIRQGITALESEDSGRAEAIQTIFSLDYEKTWRDTFFPRTPA